MPVLTLLLKPVRVLLIISSSFLNLTPMGQSFRLPLHSKTLLLYESKPTLDGKCTITHDFMPINLNRATTGNDIHMNCSTPICPGELRIRVAKGNMQARHLLILQQIAGQQVPLMTDAMRLAVSSAEISAAAAG